MDTVRFKHEIYVEIKKWIAPNFATQDDADKEGIPVEDLPADVLFELAHLWLEDLYKKAKKPRPKLIGH